MSDTYAEQWVLGAVLAYPNAWEVISVTNLRADSFVTDEHRQIWRGIERVAQSGKVIDPLTVHESMRSVGDSGANLAYLVHLVQACYGTKGLKDYADIIKRREIERAMRDAGIEIAGFAEDEKTPVDQKLDRAQALVAAIGKTSVKSVPRHVSAIAIEQSGKWDALQSGKIQPGWPTHIPSLDSALNGGLRPGALVILAARPSVGKSSFAQHIALTMAGQGLPALFLSQEMPSGELADRAVANIGRIDYSALQSGRMSHDDWSSASEALDQFASLPYSIDDQPALTIMDIRTKARMIKGLKVMVLDYLQLCSGSGDNRNAEIEQISRGLKYLAKEMGICIVALSQLNREVEKRANKRPMLADLRDSGAIEQDADIVMFLWPVRELGEQKIVGLGMDKNRQGRLLEVGLAFTGRHQRWAESTADIRQPAEPVKARKEFSE